MLPLRHEKRWRLAGIAILLIVLIAAVTPEVWAQQGQGAFRLVDRWLHVLTFLFLSLWFGGQYERSSYWRLGIALVGFGALIELGQSMIPYRSAQWADLIADIFGIGIGLVIAIAGIGGWSLRVEQWLAGETPGVD
jgi:VanZ family protein